ncbi:MAG: PepSY-associated TM helix domain-containing protein [Bryobacterales bacterium]
MFRLMRNLHLIFGLVFFVFALVFAVSSLVIIYRPWMPQSREDSERTVQVSAAGAATPRALALEMMRNHDLQGDLREIEQTEDGMQFVIVRPGTRSEVAYSSSSGEAKIQTRRQGFLEMLVQLHTNHGFWHEFLPSNAWALLSLLGSIGLFLLGATGIYLWYCHHEERVIGSVLLVAGLLYGITTLVLSRMA